MDTPRGDSLEIIRYIFCYGKMFSSEVNIIDLSKKGIFMEEGREKGPRFGRERKEEESRNEAAV